MKIGSSLKALLARLYGAGEIPAPVVPAVPVDFSETNRITGTVIRAGAFEFLARTALGEIRGRFSDPDREPPDGTPVVIRISAACIRIDTMPPEENAFAGRVVSCVPAGDNFAVRFETDAGATLNILVTGMPPACEPDESLYAWVLPEDVVGA